MAPCPYNVHVHVPWRTAYVTVVRFVFSRFRARRLALPVTWLNGQGVGQGSPGRGAEVAAPASGIAVALQHRCCSTVALVVRAMRSRHLFFLLTLGAALFIMHGQFRPEFRARSTRPSRPQRGRDSQQDATASIAASAAAAAAATTAATAAAAAAPPPPPPPFHHHRFATLPPPLPPTPPPATATAATGDAVALAPVGAQHRLPCTRQRWAIRASGLTGGSPCDCVSRLPRGARALDHIVPSSSPGGRSTATRGTTRRCCDVVRKTAVERGAGGVQLEHVQRLEGGRRTARRSPTC